MCVSARTLMTGHPELSLLEWIQALRALKVDKVAFYVYSVRDNVAKVRATANAYH